MLEGDASRGTLTRVECVGFLQWALPHLGLRYRGFRNVRGQVCKRIRRRVDELGLPDVAAYRARLEADPDEWRVLRDLCVVTISRFHRDRHVWDAMRDRVLPVLAERARATGEGELRCWSLGCASGEEPYTASIVWELGLATRFPDLRLRVVATDTDPIVLSRAGEGVYPRATLRELPAAWIAEAFEAHGEEVRLRDRFRAPVELRLQDVRDALPAETFHLVLCRNSVFTYFDEAAQRTALGRVLSRLAPWGALLLGARERPPEGAPLERFAEDLEIPCFTPARSLPDA